jgi:hypothetical protein
LDSLKISDEEYIFSPLNNKIMLEFVKSTTNGGQKKKEGEQAV